MKDRLKLLLQEMNLTQSEFADYIGVGRSSITHIMTGRDKSSQTVVSKTLLKFPEINPMWLLKGEGEMYRPHVERTHPVSPAADEDSNGTQASLFPAEEAPVEVSQPVPPAQTVISVQPVQHVNRFDRCSQYNPYSLYNQYSQYKQFSRCSPCSPYNQLSLCNLYKPYNQCNQCNRCRSSLKLNSIIKQKKLLKSDAAKSVSANYVRLSSSMTTALLRNTCLMSRK